MTKAERLFTLLGEVDAELIEEAAAPAPRGTVIHWKRWAAVAACAALILYCVPWWIFLLIGVGALLQGQLHSESIEQRADHRGPSRIVDVFRMEVGQEREANWERELPKVAIAVSEERNEQAATLIEALTFRHGKRRLVGVDQLFDNPVRF